MLSGIGKFKYIDVFIANQISCTYACLKTETAQSSSIYMLIQSCIFFIAYISKGFVYMQWITVYLLYVNFEQYHLENIPPPIGTIVIPILFEACKYFGQDERFVTVYGTAIAFPGIWRPWESPQNLIILAPLSLSFRAMNHFGELTSVYLFFSLIITIPIYYLHERTTTSMANALRTPTRRI